MLALFRNKGSAHPVHYLPLRFFGRVGRGWSASNPSARFSVWGLHLKQRDISVDAASCCCSEPPPWQSTVQKWHRHSIKAFFALRVRPLPAFPPSYMSPHALTLPESCMCVCVCGDWIAAKRGRRLSHSKTIVAKKTVVGGAEGRLGRRLLLQG